MSVEYLNGQALSADELSKSDRNSNPSTSITVVSDELRGIGERNWPHLLSRLPLRGADDGAEPQ